MSGDEDRDPIETQDEKGDGKTEAEPEKPEREARSDRHVSDLADSDSADGFDGDRRRSRRRSDGAGEAVLCRPLEVVVRDDKVDQAIRQLKNRLAREGILRELKNRRHYFKPSELKRIKRREAARRRRKQARQRARK